MATIEHIPRKTRVVVDEEEHYILRISKEEMEGLSILLNKGCSGSAIHAVKLTGLLTLTLETFHLQSPFSQIAQGK